MEVSHPYFQLPVEMVRFVYARKLQKALGLYLYLKFHCDGYIHERHPVFEVARRTLIMTDDRTFDENIKRLQRLNWIGYNAKSGNYILRGFDEIRFQYKFKKRQAVCIVADDLKHLRAFLVATIVGALIREHKFYWEQRKREAKVGMIIKGVPYQPDPSSPESPPAYYGLSNARIGKELGCSMSRACELKQEAVAQKYLWTKERFEELKCLPRADMTIRRSYYRANPEMTGKIIFKSRIRKGRKVVLMLLQLYDEIVPLVRFKSIASYSKLLHRNKALAAIEKVHETAAVHAA